VKRFPSKYFAFISPLPKIQKRVGEIIGPFLICLSTQIGKAREKKLGFSFAFSMDFDIILVLMESTHASESY